MSKFYLQCTNCRETSAPRAAIGLCEACWHPYDIVYAEPREQKELFPVAQTNTKSTSGYHPTPVIELRNIAQVLGINRLYAKLEYYSSTGSFKDRGASMLISGAVEDGIVEFIEDSSGNAGAALAAYAAKAGVSATIFLPDRISAGKLEQIRVFGAKTELIPGTRQDVTDAALKQVETSGSTYLSHNYSPYFIEGMKSFVYELSDKLLNSLDAIVFPVGNGSLLLGAWYGMREKAELNQLKNFPALCAIQSSEICPIHRALCNKPQSTQNGVTIASGISVNKPVRLNQVVKAVRETKGASAAVPDDAIRYWRDKLAQAEGIFCELTSAAVLAGIDALIKQNRVIGRASRVLIPITGTGLKELDT